MARTLWGKRRCLQFCNRFLRSSWNVVGSSTDGVELVVRGVGRFPFPAEAMAVVIVVDGREKDVPHAGKVLAYRPTGMNSAFLARARGEPLPRTLFSIARTVH